MIRVPASWVEFFGRLGVPEADLQQVMDEEAAKLRKQILDDFVAKKAAAKEDKP